MSLSVHGDFEDILISDTFPTICVDVWKNDAHHVILLTEDMLKEQVSFAAPAELSFMVFCRGLEYELNAYVYDPAVTKFKSAYLEMGFGSSMNGLVVGTTATFEIEGTAGSIVLVSENYAIISIVKDDDTMPLSTCEYTVSEDGNTLSCFGMDFTINGDGTLTPLD